MLEYLSGIKARLPATVTPVLGPDATGLGWVYQYALEDTSGRMSIADLRSLQDWNIRYALTGVPGVSEVASVGGFEKQFQVDVDPTKLLAYGIPITRVISAIRNANSDVGAMVMELSERENMVRGLGYLKSVADIENVDVGATASGTPITVRDVANVTVGPAVRRGVADLDGRGDAVGGIVIMRFGQNAMATIHAVKLRLAEVSRTLPHGVVVVPVYDRSGLIERAIDTLRSKLFEESLIVALVCVLFLLHLRSAMVAIVTLLVGVLLGFIAMGGPAWRRHHEPGGDCDQHRGDDRRRHRDDREHAQTPRRAVPPPAEETGTRSTRGRSPPPSAGRSRSTPPRKWGRRSSSRCSS